MSTGAWLAAGIITTALGTGYSAIQQQAAASQAAANTIAQGEYNRQIAEYNAQLALQEGETAKELAEQRAAGILQQAGKHIGTERSMLAANGVDIMNVDAGDSALLSFEQTAADYALTAELELWSGDEQMRSARNQAKLYRMQGQYGLMQSRSDASAYLAQAPSTLGTVLKVGSSSIMSYVAYETGS